MGRPGGGLVVGIEIEKEGAPVGGVDIAEVFYTVGQMGAAGSVGAFGIAFAIAAVVLFGIVAQGEAVLDGIDAIGGARGKVG